jgi:Tfp pilus assembly protein PilF
MYTLRNLALCAAFAIGGWHGTALSSSTELNFAELNTELMIASDLLDHYAGDPSTLTQAKAKLDEILRKDELYPPTHRLLTVYFMKAGYEGQGKFKDGALETAEASLMNALQIDPNYVDAHILAGHLYRRLKRPDEAYASLKRAELLGSTDPWLYNNWADLLNEDGKHKEASEYFMKVAESKEHNSAAVSYAISGLSRYYIAINKMDDADSLYRKKISYEPEIAWNYGNYAWFLLCKRDNYDSASAEAESAIKRLNYNAARSTLASALYRKWAAQVLGGQIVSAEKTYGQAMAVLPGNPTEIVSATCGNSSALNAMHLASKKIAANK